MDISILKLLANDALLEAIAAVPLAPRSKERQSVDNNLMITYLSSLFMIDDLRYDCHTASLAAMLLADGPICRAKAGA